MQVRKKLRITFYGGDDQVCPGIPKFGRNRRILNFSQLSYSNQIHKKCVNGLPLKYYLCLPWLDMPK